MHCTEIFDSFNRPIYISRDQNITAMGGLVAVVHNLKKIGFQKRLFNKLAPTLKDNRAQDKVRFKPMSLLWQRFLGLLCGHEDLNDHDRLGNDPGFICALGRSKLASCPTLCRFERTITQDSIDAGNQFLQEMFLSYGTFKKTLIIDVDNTPVELFGYQEGYKYNGHYRCNCYLPLMAFIDGFPIGVYNGTEDGRKALVKVFKSLIETIRKKRPDVVILLRADAGFNNVELIDLCEELGIYYLIGLSPNASLQKILQDWEPEFIDILRRSTEQGSVLRHFGEIEEYQAQTWHGPRRIIARDYFNDATRQWDPRFIQTNIPKKDNGRCAKLWTYNSQQLYETLYCNRGLAEQYNQEFKVQAHGARASSMRFLTNSYRMLLGALCQLAYRLLRTNFFKKAHHWHTATLKQFQAAFVCVPGVVRQLKTKVEISINTPIATCLLSRLWHFPN